MPLIDVDRREAYKAAILANVVYGEENRSSIDSIKGFLDEQLPSQNVSYVDFYHCPDSDTQLMITQTPEAVFVVFRGTESGKDINIDANAKKIQWPITIGGTALPTLEKVHGGFAGQALSATLLNRINEQLQVVRREKRLIITGHSLGAALATITAYLFDKAATDCPYLRPDAVYTFGSPRVGNAVFAKAYNTILKDRTFRFVNSGDVVTNVPPRRTGHYAHVGQEVAIIEGARIICDSDRRRLVRWNRFLQLTQKGFLGKGTNHLMNNYESALSGFLEGYYRLPRHYLGRYNKASAGVSVMLLALSSEFDSDINESLLLALTVISLLNQLVNFTHAVFDLDQSLTGKKASHVFSIIGSLLGTAGGILLLTDLGRDTFAQSTLGLILIAISLMAHVNHNSILMEYKPTELPPLPLIAAAIPVDHAEAEVESDEEKPEEGSSKPEAVAVAIQEAKPGGEADGRVSRGATQPATDLVFCSVNPSQSARIEHAGSEIPAPLPGAEIRSRLARFANDATAFRSLWADTCGATLKAIVATIAIILHSCCRANCEWIPGCGVRQMEDQVPAGDVEEGLDTAAPA